MRGVQRDIMNKIQKLFCGILNLAEPITKNLSDKNRERLLSIFFGLISISSYFYTISSIGVHLLVKCIIGSIFLLAIIVLSIDRKVVCVKWDKKIVVLWFAFGGMRLLSGFVTSIEYLPLACVWLIGFPCLFLVWNNRQDYVVLFRCVYRGFVYPFVAVSVISILFIKISSEAYTGLTVNPNSLGQHLCAVIPLIVIKYIYTKNKKDKIINLVIICTIMALSFYTKGRTTSLVVAGVIGAGFVCQSFILKGGWKIFLRDIVKVTFGSILAIVLYFSINSLTSNIVGQLQFNVKSNSKVEMGELVTGYVDRIEGKDKQAQGIENYSSGRTGIWEEVIRKINFFGHPSKDHIVTDRNGDVGANAHNNFLQFIYDHGVIAGVIFIILVIVSMGKSVSIVLKTKDKFMIGVFLIQCDYFCMSLLTSINLPFLYQISFIYYLSFIFLFQRKSTVIATK